MEVINNLKKRGIIKDVTNISSKNLTKCGIYVGFDPTADSLHLGNYIQIVILKHFQKAGYIPYIVLGGATGMIGDPSGKSKERNLLSQNAIEHNIKAITKQLKDLNINIFNNYEIYKDMNVLTFFRDIGKLLNINYMLSKDVIKTRLKTGISFTEFTYQLIQGWDFKYLFENLNIRIQFGGSEQWGNITSGLEIIRKSHGDNSDVFGFTTNVLEDKNGMKYGKSHGQPLWLDEQKTSPFELYQFLLNSTDDETYKLLNWLTFLSPSEIELIWEKHNDDRKKRIAQKTLASEVVRDIHGQKKLLIAKDLSMFLFGKSELKISTNNLLQLKTMATTFHFKENISLIDLLIDLEFASSKREAREFIKGGAISIMNNVIKDIDYVFLAKDIKEPLLLKRGSKLFALILMATK